MYVHFPFSVSSFFISFPALRMKGDVYPVEPEDSFMENQVLDAHWGILYEEDVRN